MSTDVRKPSRRRRGKKRRQATALLLSIMMLLTTIAAAGRPHVIYAAGAQPEAESTGSDTIAGVKTRSTLYTPAKVAAARTNAATYKWAAAMRDAAVSKADQYLAMGLEKLWSFVPGHTLPRSYGVNQALGSPVTGKEIDKYGNYPYKADPINKPWKIVDPSSGYTFPTNDFGAYYESGLDEHGIFQPELADRSLLVNTLYPEKGPTWGVDDGFGWVNEQGNRYTFIAYYVHWFSWYSATGLMNDALNNLRDAYLFTGDIKYARAGLVLLDRIADVYPEMDITEHDGTVFLNSHGGTGVGKAVGKIWETTLVKDFLQAYDAFFPAADDAQVVQFLSDKAVAYRLTNPKTSGGAIRRNIEDGIVKQVYPGVKAAQIHGNDGMHQSALAMAAVVYDKLPETKEWLDFVFQSGGLVSNPWRVTGGNIFNSLVSEVDRDGNGNEAAAGYNALWLSGHQQTADILEGYDKYPEADLYQNVKFRSMYSALLPQIFIERYTNNVGDSGSTGNPGISIKMSDMVKAFDKFGDPIFAQWAYKLNNDSADGIHRDIFEANPEQIGDKIRAAIAEYGTLTLDSVNETGYGLTAMRAGRNVKKNFGFSYGFPSMTVAQSNADYKIFDSSGTLQFEAFDTGAFIEFTFDVPKSEQYDVDLLPFRAPSYGKYRITIDGQQLTDYDFFGASTDEYVTLGRLQLAAGTHHIKFEDIGKHESSSNYKMGVRRLALLDAAARAERDNNSSQKNTLRDVTMYYGRSSGHGHRDTLQIGLHGFGLDLAPDLGYPEFADSVDMHRAQWVNNTISHNTVVVDKRKQEPQHVGQPLHYDNSGSVQLIDVAAPKVYPQTERYRRTTAMIEVDDGNSYAVDFFRVKGGNDHLFSFHGADAIVSTEGLSLTKQADAQGEYAGTYAGADVPFGQRVDDVAGPNYMGSGFHWLKNVDRDSDPGEMFSVDWQLKDTWNVDGNGAGAQTDAHLRLTMLGELDEVALADGVPPRNKPGNPPALRYLLAKRTATGGNLDSIFTSVLEPYEGSRFIASIEPVALTVNGEPSTGTEARALRVTLKDGRIDTVVSSLDPDMEYTVDGKWLFKGVFGVYSERNGEVVGRYVHDGTRFDPVGEGQEAAPAALTGTIDSFTRELSMDNELIVKMDLQDVNLAALTGSMIVIENDGVRNAAYMIRQVTDLGAGRYRIDIGTKTTIRGYADANDYSRGYLYDVAEGAAFRIPLTHQMSGLKTQAAVSGDLGDDGQWYRSAATVTLEVYGASSSLERIEYRVNDEQSWQLYTAPLVFEDGRHKLYYRSVDKTGRTEPMQMMQIQVDQTKPTLKLLANGEQAENDMELNVSDAVVWSADGADELSGIKRVSITVDGEAYEAGTPVNWLSHPGEHVVTAEAEDHAGNIAAQTVKVQAVVTAASLAAQVEAYFTAGAMDHPLHMQLANAAESAAKHAGQGKWPQAVSALERFLQHLDKKAMNDAEATAVMKAQATWLQQQWSGFMS
ncbi:FIMAH domain-containing protein [Paenibacillus sp. GCM10027626]|uniref:FIMAH domain-containing protein n=1 Tax=Paenibacillus sp. GCM10027626 TaxID=3273411 RepID=UPI003643FBD3